MARDDLARDLESDRSLLDRRSYLKLAGATAASLAATGVAASAGASSYDTITVPAGEKREFTVGDGETFENKLVDITADGASAIITATADDFAIRNVAFKGTHPGQENFLKLCVPSAGATGLVENVYFGDGAVPGSKGGIYVMSVPAHRGELTFRNLHVAHVSNNALYGSGPGYKGQPGVVHVEDSYFYSSNIANVRLGTAAATSHVRNCTIHVDDSVPGCEMNCSSPGAVNARGVWAWAGRVELHDCDVQTNGHGSNLATRDGGEIVQNGSRIGAAADTTPPEGVPMSAEEAASGGSESNDDATADDSATDDSAVDAATSDAGDSPDELPNVVVVDGSNQPRRAATYRFEVSGEIEKDGEHGSINAYDTVADGAVEGRIVGGKDAFRYSGAITDFQLGGAAIVEVHDGSE